MKTLTIISLVAFFSIQNIELSHFYAMENNDKSVSLKWVLKGTHDAAYFKIERGTDPGNFEPIGRVKASEQEVEFNFEDKTPILGDCYYRLRMVDKNGHSKYSDPIYIEVGKGKTVGIPTSSKWKSDGYYYR